MLLLDYIFRISLGLAVLFFGIAVAYFFGMNVRRLIFDVSEMEGQIIKEPNKGKKVANKLELENVKEARKHKTDSGRTRLSRNNSSRLPRTKDGFVDMDALTPQEKPVYIHDKKDRLQSNQIPFVDEDDIYDQNKVREEKVNNSKKASAKNHAFKDEDVGTSYLYGNERQGSVQNEDAGHETTYLKPEDPGDETSYLKPEEPGDETSYLSANDIQKDENIPARADLDDEGTTYLSSDNDESYLNDASDETSYLNTNENSDLRRDQRYEEDPEDEEDDNSDHTEYLGPMDLESDLRQSTQPAEEVNDKTSYLYASGDPAERYAQESEAGDETTMLTSPEYPGYSYAYDDALNETKNNANEDNVSDNANSNEFIQPVAAVEIPGSQNEIEEVDDATAYLEYLINENIE